MRYRHLIRTEVVLKLMELPLTLNERDPFNKNRSCIEILAALPAFATIPNLIRTEVVLKFLQIIKIIFAYGHLIRTEVVLKY